nr:hypothetical protein [Pseudarthrobacter psychrotolerans]
MGKPLKSTDFRGFFCFHPRLLAFYINRRTLAQRTSADKTALGQKRAADEQDRRQKTEADSRAEWWRRTQWALDRALDADEGAKALGLATLNVLAGSEPARIEELELFDAAWENGGSEDSGDWTLSASTPEHRQVQTPPNAASIPDRQVTPAGLRVRVAAAGLRVTAVCWSFQSCAPECPMSPDADPSRCPHRNMGSTEKFSCQAIGEYPPDAVRCIRDRRTKEKRYT